MCQMWIYKGFKARRSQQPEGNPWARLNLEKGQKPDLCADLRKNQTHNKRLQGQLAQIVQTTLKDTFLDDSMSWLMK